jgi:RNA polymerase sigma-32 factor
VARELQVKPEEVVEMETRLSGGDVALEPQADDGEDDVRADRLPGRRAPRARRARWRPRSRDWLRRRRHAARRWRCWTPRSRRIVEERWLKVNDDASGGMTLHELAAEYGVSAERIRQIEVAALKKMRQALETA